MCGRSTHQITIINSTFGLNHLLQIGLSILWKARGTYRVLVKYGTIELQVLYICCMYVPIYFHSFSNQFLNIILIVKVFSLLFLRILPHIIDPVGKHHRYLHSSRCLLFNIYGHKNCDRQQTTLTGLKKIT